ncbi:MAG: flagellar hook-associated protein FlgK [Bryobacterales bacterium]|nr:flagellar hook-associated protein FlgK [Bryobacterales bacterium]
MSNLLTALVSSSNALEVLQRALIVSQNNVANASTPGYAAQRMLLQAMEFEPGEGLIGGVRAGQIQSARDLYAEQAVRRQMESLGRFKQMAESLASLEPVFNATGASGIPGALNRLFSSFSAWSADPNSMTARQAVLDSAGQLVQSFRQADASLEKAARDTDRQLHQTVERINQLGSELLACNAARRRGASGDAGLDARIQNVLEELSELVDFTSLQQEDGTVTVLIGGQGPLVVGEHLYGLRLNFDMPAVPPPLYPGAPAPVRLEAFGGGEITGLVQQGRLGGLLEFRNTVLPSVAGDAYHTGELNVLAGSLAGRINQILAAGRISDGPPPQPGVALFTYDVSNAATAARTLDLNPAITAGTLAAISPGPPYVSNGTALRLAELSNPREGADGIEGHSYVEYYGRLAGRVGRLLADAGESRNFGAEMVAQARFLREQLSGVSLDEEAIRIIEYQRAYQANARMVSVLSDMTEIAVNLLR